MVDAIVRTLLKIHADRNIDVDVTCETEAKFRGERQDLEEMLGNLLDNAFKWTASKVAVDIALVDDKAGDGRLWLDISVNDDGPGLPEDQRAQALQRGQRLDETKPGSGLGLSIVSETAAMYNGSVRLGAGKLPGLLATIRLPALKG